MEHPNCNLCGMDDAALLWTLPDLALGRSAVFATFVRCRKCGLIYQAPRPTLAEMGQHYPPEYELYSPEPTRRDDSWLSRQAIQYGLSKRVRFVTRSKRAGLLLDVGCASGHFLNAMRGTGDWQVQGVEINGHAARMAREGYGLRVHTGTLEDAHFATASFDVVTLWDVLEHLHDPKKSLCEIRRLLKPQGILLLRVPNADSWDARIFGRFWAGWEPPRHLYVFSPATLRELIADSGLSVQTCSGGSAAYTTFLFSMRLWASTQPPNRGRDALIQFLHHASMRLLTVPFFYLSGLVGRGPLMVVSAVHRGESFDTP